MLVFVLIKCSIIIIILFVSEGWFNHEKGGNVGRKKTFMLNNCELMFF